jgi:hypothetical protein
MSILKREVYFDNTSGLARFWDWAVTTTTLGVMAEPFSVGSVAVGTGLSGNGDHIDPTDEIARIDALRAAPRDFSIRYLSGDSGLALNGGDLRPRTGP